MAESAVFSLASKILSTIASPAFEKAYEKGLSIWEASDELAKLRETIETIQAVLLDAEKKQKDSAAVKNWIKRLKCVLYDADDLFEEVATDDLLKQQMRKGNDKLSLKSKVRVSCSSLNPILSRNSIAKKVKAIGKSLGEISRDMAQFEFVRCQHEEPISGMRRRGQDPGYFVDIKKVIGRDEDKKVILEMFFDESANARRDVLTVIAVVGIGGMGKTTLAQLIYNDEKVKRSFKNMWFACISDTSDEIEVLGKIFHSICGQNYIDFTTSQLQIKIREKIEGKNFLLVLDDVWDEDHGRWQHIMGLLSAGAEGSKIIVTTRSTSVAEAVEAFHTHKLGGLSEDDSWDLFKRVAFAPGYENDSRRVDLGREIVKKCANVPLAIRSIGSLLYTKSTIQEWELFKDQDLSSIEEQSGHDPIMSVLRLSYEHLPSKLKCCFAYCSQFQKDFEFNKQKLIYLWISQGYIKPDHEMQSVEQTGHLYFMELVRRGFFEEVREYDKEIWGCKLHDLMHDLAQHVAGEESITLTGKSSNTSKFARHVSVYDLKMDDLWAIPAQLHSGNRLRSFLFMKGSAISRPTLDQLLAKFNFLRVLSLSSLEIESVSSSIWKLKYLRYLDLSMNEFQSLPNSMTNLVNLLTLDINGCKNLKALPDDLKKLINLRCLNIEGCRQLKHMPAGMGEMSSLQYLSDFKIGKATSEKEGVKRSGLDVLARLRNQLRGELSIEFEYGMEEDWDRDECSWHLPVSLEELWIWYYPGLRIPHWGIDGMANNLASLNLIDCREVKYLPPLRRLPNLKYLTLYDLKELEYVEEEEEEKQHQLPSMATTTSIGGFVHNNANSSICFPSLEKLRLHSLPGLKGWWRKVASASSTAPLQFPRLSQLSINVCPMLELKSLPLCPHLRLLNFYAVGDNEMTQQQLPSTICCSTAPPGIEEISISHCHWLLSLQVSEALSSLRFLVINKCGGLKSLHLASPHLQTIEISDCNELAHFELLVEAPATSLRVLKFERCKKLKNFHIAAQLNALEKLTIAQCPELELWESQDNTSVDWDSLSNLRKLNLSKLPDCPERLPYCLRHRQAIGKLKISHRSSSWRIKYRSDDILAGWSDYII